MRLILNFINHLLKISGYSEVSAEDENKWMVSDSSDSGFYIIKGDELIEILREESVEEDDEKCLPAMKPR